MKKVVIVNKGRPKEHIDARIRLMREQERIADKRRKRNIFMTLDAVAVLSFIFSIVLFYFRRYLNAVLALLITILILSYFIARKYTYNFRKK